MKRETKAIQAPKMWKVHVASEAVKVYKDHKGDKTRRALRVIQVRRGLQTDYYVKIDGSNAMTGHLNMENQKIKSLGTHSQAKMTLL